MVKPIIKDIEFLGKESEPTTKTDKKMIRDLQDTFRSHHKECVGMAANMIGYTKRTIIVSAGVIDIIMHNPEIVAGSDEYETNEGCLSLDGTRKTKRFKNIEVRYQDIKFNKRVQKFSGYTAQIIQHEIDHLNGIII